LFFQSVECSIMPAKAQHISTASNGQMAGCWADVRRHPSTMLPVRWGLWKTRYCLVGPAQVRYFKKINLTEEPDEVVPCDWVTPHPDDTCVACLLRSGCVVAWLRCIDSTSCESFVSAALPVIQAAPTFSESGCVTGSSSAKAIVPAVDPGVPSPLLATRHPIIQFAPTSETVGLAKVVGPRLSLPLANALAITHSASSVGKVGVAAGVVPCLYLSLASDSIFSGSLVHIGDRDDLEYLYSSDWHTDDWEIDAVEPLVTARCWELDADEASMAAQKDHIDKLNSCLAETSIGVLSPGTSSDGISSSSSSSCLTEVASRFECTSPEMKFTCTNSQAADLNTMRLTSNSRIQLSPKCLRFASFGGS